VYKRNILKKERLEAAFKVFDKVGEFGRRVCLKKFRMEMEGYQQRI